MDGGFLLHLDVRDEQATSAAVVGGAADADFLDFRGFNRHDSIVLEFR
jgi:hypothetical protein